LIATQAVNQFTVARISILRQRAVAPPGIRQVVEEAGVSGEYRPAYAASGSLSRASRMDSE
jgi:hypothetical protein